MPSVLSLNAADRQQGAVAHLFHGYGSVINMVNPPFHHHVFHVGHGINLIARLHKQLL